MGNCVFKTTYTSSATVDHHHRHMAAEQVMIKVATTTGGIMELYAPITADQITSEFPGHGLFRTPGSSPLLPHHRLHPGRLYYLLPLSSSSAAAGEAKILSTPYRMSFDAPTPRAAAAAAVAADELPRRCNGTNKGVWKVRLVINPEQLSEILSQEAKTEELIESVRTVAKCGGGGGAATGVTSASVSVAGSSNYSDNPSGSSASSSSLSSCHFSWR